MHIREWPTSEKPREKLQTRGSSNLSDAELLAVLFGTGTQGQDVMQWARALLQQSGGLSELLSLPTKQLLKLKGIGIARSMQLQVILEIARRYLASALELGTGFTNPQLVRDFLASKLQHQEREVFALLLLDNQHRLLHYEELFYGTINAAPIYPREIVKLILNKNAAAIILAHNHPSGVAEPSEADRQVTRKIQQALSTIDVPVLDHFVIGMGQAVSFAERGYL